MSEVLQGGLGIENRHFSTSTIPQNRLKYGVAEKNTQEKDRLSTIYKQFVDKL